MYDKLLLPCNKLVRSSELIREDLFTLCSKS
jgi:hypothetical protein